MGTLLLIALIATHMQEDADVDEAVVARQEAVAAHREAEAEASISHASASALPRTNASGARGRKELIHPLDAPSQLRVPTAEEKTTLPASAGRSEKTSRGRRRSGCKPRSPFPTPISPPVS